MLLSPHHYTSEFESVLLLGSGEGSLSNMFSGSSRFQLQPPITSSSRETEFHMDTSLDSQRPSSSDPPVYPIRTPSPWPRATTSEPTSSRMQTDPIRSMSSFRSRLPDVRGSPSSLYQLIPPIGSERRRRDRDSLTLADLDPAALNLVSFERTIPPAVAVNPVSQSPVSPIRVSSWNFSDDEEEDAENKVPILSVAEFKELLDSSKRKNPYTPAMFSPLNPLREHAPPRFRTELPPCRRLRMFRTPLVRDSQCDDDGHPLLPRKVEGSLRKALLHALHYKSHRPKPRRRHSMLDLPTESGPESESESEEVMDIRPLVTLAQEFDSAGVDRDELPMDVDVDLPSLTDNYEERIPSSPHIRDADDFDDFAEGDGDDPLLF